MVDPTNQSAQANLVRHRPRVLKGKTYKIKTPVGTGYFTINDDDKGEPFEVFVNVSRVGSAVMADAEAIGRLISSTLQRSTDPRGMVLVIIDQLRGIGGGQSIGFGPNRITSLADAVAKAFEIHLGLVTADSAEIVEEKVAVTAEKIGDLCPQCGQATLLHEEGCQKCTSCGYTKC